MSGFEVIGVIISAIPVVTKLVKHFGTHRNAPRQVERLSRVLAELKDPRLIEAAMPVEQEHIREMLDRCTDLLDREMATGQKSRAWKFFWSAEAEDRLKEHNDELETELGRLQLRVYMNRRPSTPPRIVHSSPRDVQTPPLESKEFLPSPPPKYRSDSVASPPRRASVNGLELPVTLCLQNPYGKRIGEKMRLQTLTIIERDDMWRRIQYVGRGPGGAEVRVTHRIPRGNIWFEDEDLEDLSVSFLEAHDITIQNAEGYKVYRSYSIYQFGTVAHRENFLVHVRERQLLGRYFAEKIWERGELIAQQKVVRLWRKTTSRESQKTTLSFIGRDERPYERPVVDFRRSPTLRENRVELVEVVGGSKTTLEFRRPPKPARKRSRIFGSRSKSSASLVSEDGTNDDSDAARFKAAFEANHPATSTFSPLTLRPTGGEANFHEVPGLSPSLPALSPTSSTAPTLDTISLPPASIASLPDDLPISPRSSVMPVIKDEDLFP